MALIKCPECGKEISDQAPACIHCGFPLSKLKPVKKEGEVLKRRKVSIATPIIVFLISTFIFGVAISACAVGIAINAERGNSQLSFACSVGVVLLVATVLVSMGGLIVTIIDRAKNNNRVEINLIEYDKDNNLLTFRSFKDETLSIKPESVRYLDGSSKVYLYYFTEDEKKKKRVMTLGFANKNDIKDARAVLEGLKTEDKAIK